VLYDLGRYPGAIADASATGKISGTVMELPDDSDVLRALDEYEGFDPQSPETSEFVRERQEVELASGGTLLCWFYRYNRKIDAARVFPSGVWQKKYLEPISHRERGIPTTKLAALARQRKQKNSGGNSRVYRIAAATHRDPKIEVRRVEQLIGKAVSFAADEERGRPTTAK